MISGIPYWRLSAVYWGYFAVIGGLSPYWGAYLNALGFAPQTIGFIAAIPMFTRLVAPYLWGSLADKGGRRMAIARLGVTGAVLSFLPVLWVDDFWPLALFTFLFSFFWNAVLPQFEVLTHHYLGERDGLYSRVRLWGSVGFIVMVLGLGVWFDRYSIAHLPYALLLGFLCVFFVLFTLPVAPSETHQPAAKGDLIAILRKPSVWSFFVAVTLLQMSHGVYYGFYTIYLQDYGYSRTIISLLWSVGVVAEIVLFLLVPSIFRRFSVRSCLGLSMVLAATRWLIVALIPESFALLAVAQLGHAFSFGLVHASAMATIKRYFPKALAGRSQALYSALGYGAGAALGTYIAGWLWFAGGHWAFLFASVLALAGACVVFYFMPKAYVRGA